MVSLQQHYRRLAGSTGLILLTLLAGPAVAQLCATPGKDGQRPPQAVINSYFSGASEQTLQAGQRFLPLSRQRGDQPLSSGDLALLIQIQGARIATADDHRYGALLDHQLVQEWLRIDQVDDHGIHISGSGPQQGLRHSYVNRPASAQQGAARWQLVRVPQFEQLRLQHDISALPWDGHTGGILALDVRRQLDLAGHSLTVAGLGLRGGPAISLAGALGRAGDWRYPAPDGTDAAAGYGHHGSKGEGIAGSPALLLDNGNHGYPQGDMARGAPANAGGGGNGLDLDHQQLGAGGGGGNGSAGQPGQPQPGGGQPGQSLNELGALTLGGGGGAGARYRGDGASGGNGGGILVIRSAGIDGDGSLDLRGQAGGNGLDSAGGGGAGGTLYLDIPENSALRARRLLAGGPGGNQQQGGSGGEGRQLSARPLANPVLATLAIDGVQPGYLCQPAGHGLSGQLFQDDSPDGALNNHPDPGEAPLSGWPLQVTTDSGDTLAETHSDANGHFQISLDEAQSRGQRLWLTLPMPAGWHSSTLPRLNNEQADVVRDGLRWPFQAHSDSQSPALALGMVPLPQWQSRHTRAVSLGDTAVLTFEYQASLNGAVRFNSISHPDANLLIDQQCSGNSEQWQATERPWWPVKQGQRLCVRLPVTARQPSTTVIVDVQTRPKASSSYNPLPVLSARATLHASSKPNEQ